MPPSPWPAEAKGVAPVEAPRGALAHWVKIKDTKIENYQCVVPTTWNGSPRDHKGQIGAFEASLLNTPMADPEQPLLVSGDRAACSEARALAALLADVSNALREMKPSSPDKSVREN